MNDLVNPKHPDWLAPEDQQSSHEKGLYIKEDDQDWGSAGMNDVQNDPE